MITFDNDDRVKLKICGNKGSSQIHSPVTGRLETSFYVLPTPGSLSQADIIVTIATPQTPYTVTTGFTASQV